MIDVPGANKVYPAPTAPPEPVVPPRRALVEYRPALTLSEDGSIPARNFSITTLGLIQTGEVSEQDWLDVGDAIFKFSDVFQLAVGDWLNYGANFNHSIEQISVRLSRDEKTLRNWARIADSLPVTLRRVGLTIGHYSLLAGVKDGELRALGAQRAADGKWPVAKLRLWIKERSPKPKQAIRRGSKKDVTECRKNAKALVARLKRLDAEDRLVIVEEMAVLLEGYV